jgi:hypothetical protein
MGPSIHSIVREQAGDRAKPNETILDPDSEAEKTDAVDGRRVSRANLSQRDKRSIFCA